MPPASAAACAASSWVSVSLMWKVPANAASGATAVSRRRGSRCSSMLTFTWAPSGALAGRDIGTTRPQQPLQHRRSDAAEHEPPVQRLTRRRA